MEIKIAKNNKNTTDYPNWFGRNKFKNILVIIDSNKFTYKHKTGEFKYNDIKDLVNNIINNTINGISAKKGLNILNEIKNAEIITCKMHTLKLKELLNLFNDLLDTILTDTILKSKSQKDKILMSSNENENRNENGNENGNKNRNENVNDKRMSSSEDDNETMNQNNSNIIKQLNDDLDKIIDESKSFENQIKSIK